MASLLVAGLFAGSLRWGPAILLRTVE